MDAITTFDSTKRALLDLLRAVRDGKTQLPDFQRGWVWDDEHIRSLLASVSLSFPIGAVMMLQTGNPDVRFKPRPVEGVQLAQPTDPEELILDGQQRLTSLFQALSSGQVVATRDARKVPMRRWYYVDIYKALDPAADREEAIVALPEDRIVRNFRGEPIADVSTPAEEYARGLFPLSKVFNCASWRAGFNKHWDHHPAKTELFDRFEQEVIERFKQYQMPVILLYKQTPKEAVCQVFEKVNTGGVVLTVFELLTATFAADNYHLRDDWEARAKRLKKHAVLGTIESTEFLQAVTLLTTRDRRVKALASGIKPADAPGVTCKRRDILKLTLAEYKTWADAATVGFERVAKILHGQRIFAPRDVPYYTQLVPLATLLAVLGDRGDNDGVRAKLARWFWCGIFGELYGGAIETRMAKDVPQMLAWVDGGAEPDTITEANFYPSRLLGLRTRNSAAYKGLHALLLRDGGLDFRTGDPVDLQLYFDEKIDIHHIFPSAWAKGAKIDKKRCDCIINKTPLSAKTNRMVGGNAPSVYLGKVQKSASIDAARMDEILRTHVIDPAALRSDDFAAFFEVREKALLARIEKAMGKPTVGGVAVPDTSDEDDEEDDAV